VQLNGAPTNTLQQERCEKNIVEEMAGVQTIMQTFQVVDIAPVTREKPFPRLVENRRRRVHGHSCNSDSPKSEIRFYADHEDEFPTDLEASVNLKREECNLCIMHTLAKYILTGRGGARWAETTQRAPKRIMPLGMNVVNGWGIMLSFVSMK